MKVEPGSKEFSENSGVSDVIVITGVPVETSNACSWKLCFNPPSWFGRQETWMLSAVWFKRLQLDRLSGGPAGQMRNKQGSLCQPTSFRAQQATVPKSASTSGRKRRVSPVAGRTIPPVEVSPPEEVSMAVVVTSFQPRVVFMAHLNHSGEHQKQFY